MTECEVINVAVYSSFIGYRWLGHEGNRIQKWRISAKEGRNEKRNKPQNRGHEAQLFIPVIPVQRGNQFLNFSRVCGVSPPRDEVLLFRQKAP